MNLNAGFEIDHELEGALIVASLLRDFAGKLGQRLWARQLDREESVPAHGAAEGPSVRPTGRDPDGDPRRLHRAWLELPGPKLDQAAEPVVESLRTLAGVHDFAERFELIVSDTAEPDAENQASLAQVIEGDRLACDLVHTPPGEWRDEGSESEAFGVRRDRAQRHPRVGDRSDRWSVEDVIPQEHAVPAVLLGMHGQSDEHFRIGQVVERREVEPPPKAAIV